MDSSYAGSVILAAISGSSVEGSFLKKNIQSVLVDFSTLTLLLWCVLSCESGSLLMFSWHP